MQRTLRLARLLNEFPERELDEHGELDIVMGTAEYAHISGLLQDFTDAYYYTENTPEAADTDGIVTLSMFKSYDIIDLIVAGFDVIGMTAFYKDAEPKPNAEFLELLALREKNLARSMLAAIVYDDEATKILPDTNQARMIFYSDERVQEVMDLYKLAKETRQI